MGIHLLGIMNVCKKKLMWKPITHMLPYSTTFITILTGWWSYMKSHRAHLLNIMEIYQMLMEAIQLLLRHFI